MQVLNFLVNKQCFIEKIKRNQHAENWEIERHLYWNKRAENIAVQLTDIGFEYSPQ